MWRYNESGALMGGVLTRVHCISGVEVSPESNRGKVSPGISGGISGVAVSPVVVM